MQRIVTRVLGMVLVAVVGVFAITGGSGVDAPEVSGASPLAPQAVAEPDLSDQVLFVDGEPVTPFNDEIIGDLPVVGGALPLAPEGMQEPDLSNQVLFIDGEPVTGFDGDTAWVLNN